MSGDYQGLGAELSAKFWMSKFWMSIAIFLPILKVTICNIGVGNKRMRNGRVGKREGK